MVFVLRLFCREGSGGCGARAESFDKQAHRLLRTNEQLLRRAYIAVNRGQGVIRRPIAKSRVGLPGGG